MAFNAVGSTSSRSGCVNSSTINNTPPVPQNGTQANGSIAARAALPAGHLVGEAGLEVTGIIPVGEHPVPGPWGEGRLIVPENTACTLKLELVNDRLKVFSIAFSNPLKVVKPAGSFVSEEMVKSMMPTGAGFLSGLVSSGINQLPVKINGLAMRDADGVLVVQGTLFGKSLEGKTPPNLEIQLARDMNRWRAGEAFERAPTGAHVPPSDRLLTCATDMMPKGRYKVWSTVTQTATLCDRAGHTQSYPGPVKTYVEGTFELSPGHLSSRPQVAWMSVLVGQQRLTANLYNAVLTVPGPQPGLNGTLRGDLTVAAPNGKKTAPEKISLTASLDGVVLDTDDLRPLAAKCAKLVA